MTQASLLVIQHEDECPPAWFGEWFALAGLEYDVVAAHLGDPVPDELHSWSGLLVLGGDMGAYDDTAHPWLTATKRLIAATVAASQPMLGICLGHQLASVALGGEVAPNPNGHARGLTPLGLTQEGSDDVLLASVRPGAPSVMWNNDVVTRLPPGAVELARSRDGTVQAARYADQAWGVQLHPEVSPDVFDSWTVNKPSAVHPGGLDVAAAAHAIRAAEAALRSSWQPLATRFAAITLGRLPASVTSPVS